jgi:hypothetical protein
VYLDWRASCLTGDTTAAAYNGSLNLLSQNKPFMLWSSRANKNLLLSCATIMSLWLLRQLIHTYKSESQQDVYINVHFTGEKVAGVSRFDRIQYQDHAYWSSTTKLHVCLLTTNKRQQHIYALIFCWQQHQELKRHACMHACMCTWVYTIHLHACSVLRIYYLTILVYTVHMIS